MRIFFVALFVLASVENNIGRAQFATVINIPSASLPDILGSNTQVNLAAGGVIESSVSGLPYHLGQSDGSSTNIEFNVSGGTMRGTALAFAGTTVHVGGGVWNSSLQLYSGSRAFISGGNGPGLVVKDGANAIIDGGENGARVENGGKLTINGGLVNNLIGHTNSLISITGGKIGGGSEGVSINSKIDIHGGAYGKFNAYSLADVALYGGEFRLDGQLIGGLEQVGDTVAIDIPNRSVLSGTLTDGTPIVFTALKGSDGDSLAPGVLKLKATSVPPPLPADLLASRDPTPRGLREGQTLRVDAGQVLGNYFTAGRGSTLIVDPGGTVGNNLRSVAATVKISGKLNGDLVAVDGSQIELSAGSSMGSVFAQRSRLKMTGRSAFGVFLYDSTFDVERGGTVEFLRGMEGSEINVHGGRVGTIGSGSLQDTVQVNRGGVMNLFGGTLGDVSRIGGTFNLAGGTLGRFFSVDRGGVLNVSGGSFGQSLYIDSGAELNFLGTEFKLDGEPIPRLQQGVRFVLGDRGRTLSGVLADGSPFERFLSPTISAGAKVTLTLVPEPQAFSICLMAFLFGFSKRRALLACR
ncbi:cupredoxin domain-containing protein [Lacipirellula limnantheis]|uniref:Uncharacterized protein n=1 Tax=Lacipirellula limnantheis TaxID=2528024 RepID=A0A517U1R3_9BACT|nr:hypothetical protein [Lacipirellula limnantheis]QDT74552.1 hypothetical protein I41_37490 [Lacipirellula limnantheis]